jgi:putative sigma-54 modulation protein
MEMQIAGKNLELSPAIRSYITKKMEKINRHLTNILSFEIVGAEEKTRAPEQRFILQATINSNGILLRGEERGPDLYTATDKVAEVMNRQIERYKGKMESSRVRSAASIRNNTAEVNSAIAEETSDTEPRIVKTKRFDVKPMSLEEAVDQMVLLDHDFFLFYNPDSNNMNLIYKRKDGNYGLIEPVTK